MWSKWRPAGKFPDRVWECLFYSFAGNLLWASLRHARLSLPTVPLCWNHASIMKFSPSWQKKISFNTCTICALECQWVPSNRKLSSKWNKTNADAISKREKKSTRELYSLGLVSSTLRSVWSPLNRWVCFHNTCFHRDWQGSVLVCSHFVLASSCRPVTGFPISFPLVQSVWNFLPLRMAHYCSY